MKNGITYEIDKSVLLTIGMPVFNDVEFIDKSIQCIIDQTYRNWQLIISDDCSTDGSEEICRHYANGHPNITYIRQETNIGISKNMRFLLRKANTPFFMWAGDDDLIEPKYIDTLVSLLTTNKNAIAAFTPYYKIDDTGKRISGKIECDFRGKSPADRLKKFISQEDDAFGYGLFRAKDIHQVKFPKWWWPNRNQSYNNIFPSLCYYLSKGEYEYCNDEVLFSKRIKSDSYRNHSKSRYYNGIDETFRYIFRRFYLVIYSAIQISRASNLFFAVRMSPYLAHYWLIRSIIRHFTLIWNSKFK